MKSSCQRIPTHLWVAGSGWLGRGVTALVGMLTIRALVSSLGGDNYAAYAILSGVHGWCLLADFGLGASLQNHISERRARHEDYSSVISMAALASILLLFIAFAVLCVAAAPLSKVLLKGFPHFSDLQKTHNLLLLGGLSMLTALGGITYSIWFSEQKGYLANLLPAFATTIGYFSVIEVAQSGLEDRFFWSILAAYAPAALLPIGGFVWQLKKHLKLKNVIARDGFPLWRRAAKFWVFALMSAGVLQIDYLVMSQFLAAGDIIVYNLASKVFMLVFFLYNALLTAIWPVFAELATEYKWDTIWIYMKRYLLAGTILISAFTLIFSLYSDLVVNILAPGEALVLPREFIYLLGAYFVLRVWSDTFAVALFSMSYLRPFFLFVPFQAILSLLFQWFLVPEIGIYGAVLGLIGSFLLSAVWVLPLAFKYRVKIAGSNSGLPGEVV